MKDFKLSDKFIEKFRGEQPKWGYGATSYITYKRTYSRKICNHCNSYKIDFDENEEQFCTDCDSHDIRTEEYWETVRRVVEGCYTIQKQHCQKFKLLWDNRRAQRSAQTMFQKIWEFKFTPPGRGFWMMGTEAIEKKGGGGLQNCGFVSTQDISVDFAGPFCWAMDFLMLGVGIGFDVKGAGQFVVKEPAENTGQQYILPDTREGWVEALRQVLVAFEKGSAIPTFDFSNIRKLGTPIRTFGGTASGPEPLQELLTRVEEILRSKIDDSISSVDIVDIFNYIGKAVVAGNVRRSAELALGPVDDHEYVTCKDPKLHLNELMDRRWASNNSIDAEVGMDYEFPASRSAINGEPGYIWLDNARLYGRLKDRPNNKDYRVMGFNPCAEQSLESKELCNLVETYPANHDSVEEYIDTLKYAYLYAKTVTLIPTHDEYTNGIMTRNRRIGTSMSGIEQAKKKFGLHKFYSEFCDKGYEALKQYDRTYSDWLGIAKSIKLSTVKPSGTVSLLAGATSGVHAAHSEFYMRTMRLAHNSPLIPVLMRAGYRIEYSAIDELCKDGTLDATKRITNVDPRFKGDLIAYFPIKERDFTKGKEDQTIWEQAENAAKMQYYWSDNSVSITVNFKEDEARQIATVLDHYQTRLKTISFLPLKDHGYKQAPLQTITEEEYNEAIKDLKPISAIDIGSSDKQIEAYCEGDKCTIN